LLGEFWSDVIKPTEGGRIFKLKVQGSFVLNFGNFHHPSGSKFEKSIKQAQREFGLTKKFEFLLGKFEQRTKKTGRDMQGKGPFI